METDVKTCGLRARIDRVVQAYLIRFGLRQPPPVVVAPEPTGRIFISGTGRAGTTFLVGFLTELGLDTGFERMSRNVPDAEGAEPLPSDAETEAAPADQAQPAAEIDAASQFFPIARAGFERNLFATDNPRIVKSPYLCDQLDAVIAAGIEIDHIIIPVRDLTAAAESRRYVQKQTTGSEDGSSVAGGLWDTEKHEAQEAVLATKFINLVEAVVRHDVPVTFLAFPRLVKDPRYLHEKLCPLFPDLSLADFEAAFHAVVRPDWVHDFGTVQKPETGADAAISTGNSPT